MEERIVIGDEPAKIAFEDLMADHLDSAYNLARWILPTVEDAEDVVQDAFIRAFKGYAGFRGGNARAWILTIVRNTAYNHLRKYRNAFESLSDEDDSNSFVSEDLDPVQKIIHDGELLDLKTALDQLPPEYREAIVLHEIEDMPYKEIARIQSIPIGTVMSRISRARVKLRAMLAVDNH